jgi:hypothetical protein
MAASAATPTGRHLNTRGEITRNWGLIPISSNDRGVQSWLEAAVSQNDTQRETAMLATLVRRGTAIILLGGTLGIDRHRDAGEKRRTATA